MLAYLFWHQPRERSAVEAYEHALLAFHRSLAHAPPAGFLGSACYRAAAIPWLGGEYGYEDWYFVEDYTALGVLNEAAVAHGHSSVHDEVARRFGSGAGGLYGLIEGHENRHSALDEQTSAALWIARPPGSRREALAALLGDGMDPQRASLWRRQLVFGPAPEYCLLAGEPPAGVAPARLPVDWTVTTVARERLWHG